MVPTLQIEMVWLDLETTGLAPNINEILEIAVVGTDRFGENPQVLFSELVMPHNWPVVRDCMDEVVQDMHAQSGLSAALDAMRNTSHQNTKKLIQERLLRVLENQLPGQEGKLPMCGNTINFDRGFLHHHMPDLEAWFHYRNIDVSTIKNVCRMLNPAIYGRLPEKSKNHRALADVYESIAEYRFYVDNFLWLGE